jgi:ketosteroid isomerase-like protein
MQNSNLGGDPTALSISDENINNSCCMGRSLITYKNMEAVFKDNSRKLLPIKLFYLGLRAHDTKLMLNQMSEDVQFWAAGRAGTVPLAGMYNGKQEVKGYLEGFLSKFSKAQMVFQFNIVDGTWVNTHVQLIAQVPTTGKTLDGEFIYNWMLNEKGKIKYMHLYYDTNSWYNAFHPGGPNYVADIKGDTNFEVNKLSFDPLFLVQETYNTFNCGDIPGVMDKFDDQFVFILKGGDPIVPFEGKFYGKTGFLQWLNLLMSSATYLGMPENRYFVVQGNRVDAHVYEELMCLATGKIFRSEICQSWIVGENGKLLEFKSYNDQFEVVQAFQP